MDSLINNILACTSVKELKTCITGASHLNQETVLIAIKKHGLQFNLLWCLKQCLKSNLSESETSILLKNLLQEANEFSRLIVLQCAPKLSISEDVSATWEHFLAQCKQSKNGFVKSSYYNGFIPMAKLAPELIPEYIRTCDADYEAATNSGKARIRNVKKELLRIKKAE